MSSEKKISEQECMNVDKEMLDQVSGGKGGKLPCPMCGSFHYYDYTEYIDGNKCYAHHCPDCGYTEIAHVPVPLPK